MDAGCVNFEATRGTISPAPAIVIIASRGYFGETVFNAWAWRIPFLFSFLLVLVTLYMRSNFEESPVYAEIKSKGLTSKNPWRDAFLNRQNLKYVVIATIVVLGEGVVWYSSQFWALFYLQTVSKVDTLSSSFIVGIGLVIGTPSLILFGWLSDKIGRKPVILGGFLVAALTYYPLYSWLGAATQPGAINWPIVGLSWAVTLFLLALGSLHFSRTERVFADIV